MFTYFTHYFSFFLQLQRFRQVGTRKRLTTPDSSTHALHADAQKRKCACLWEVRLRSTDVWHFRQTADRRLWATGL